MKNVVVAALAAFALLAAQGATHADEADGTARDRFAAACADDVSRLCAIRHLGGDEAEVSCSPITREDATPACVAAYRAMRASLR